MIKVALVGTHGLPAQYGAFEQTVSKICEFSDETKFQFLVSTDSELSNRDYCKSNVTRIFFRRWNTLATPVRLLWIIIYNYINGCRNFVFFGYSAAPFFKLMEIFGCKVCCNVDGFEWRRAKWGRLAKGYFKFCECCAVSSGATLVYDALTIKRYYRMKHGRDGALIRYGCEDISIIREQQIDLPENLIESPFYVVTMRMEPENNIDLIVNAFLMSNTEASLVLIGPTTPFFETNVLPLVAKDSRVKYAGPIYDRTKLLAIRSLALGYVHGHSVGGTNPTLVEACFLERPVLAFDTNFNREVCGANAMYFSDEEQLTKHFDGDVEKYPRPPRLNHEYDWQKIVTCYENIME